MIRLLTIGVAMWPGHLAALTLDLPVSARETAARDEIEGSYDVPLSPFSQGDFERFTHSGQFSQRAYRIAAPGLSTEQILAPLRGQLQDAGFEVLLDCATRICGGFDFRFATDVIPAPDMFVDLGDFRFLSARGDAGFVTLMVSRTAEAGYVQITQTGKAAAEIEVTATTQVTRPVIADGAVGEALVRDGRAILGDLTFDTGSATLGAGPFTSLAEVAEFLQDNPGLTLALVGHTDSAGALDVNIALSKRRAEAVRTRLIDKFGIPGAQIEAEGMGYLAPVASNLTETGRERNRRVEVIVTSTRP